MVIRISIRCRLVSRRYGELNILAAALVVGHGEARGGLVGALDVLGVLAHDGETALAVGADANGLFRALEFIVRVRHFHVRGARDRYLVVDEASMLNKIVNITVREPFS